jgi:hypothetical protein
MLEATVVCQQGTLAVAVNNGIRPDAAFHHPIEAVQHPLPSLAPVVAHQHVDQQGRRPDTVPFERVDTAEEPLLVSQIIPGGV